VLRDALKDMIAEAKVTITGRGKQAMSARTRIGPWSAELRHVIQAIWKMEKYDQGKPVSKVQIVVSGGTSAQDRKTILAALARVGCTPGELPVPVKTKPK